MTQPKTNRVPAPLYAAAGAGDLALEQLRRLPAVFTEFGGRAVVTGVELRQKATETLRTANETATGLRDKATPAELQRLREAADLNKLREAADLDRLRDVATRNAAVVFAGAQAAQGRALAAYAELVARGERVVGAGVLEAAETVNADIEATEAPAPAATPTTEVPSPAEVAEVVEAKPKAVRPRAARATKSTVAKATPVAKAPKATKRTRPAAE
ncbi:hypothetical protein K7640_14405 [Micromonospora sp. PLK6-60]|uniref:hypothetical protein n=1 Tax=Micromonospora sp. PLK6-60 TaxID=2873383 RepID=UPI001CA6F164|nr:hypothetical protein [Micromonospora sp. PLK6-60]MBY8873024.1 hypothetical protein [Micromonospora sp. PLK6-60]